MTVTPSPEIDMEAAVGSAVSGANQRMETLESYYKAILWGIPLSFLLMGMTVLVIGWSNNGNIVQSSALLIVLLATVWLVSQWIASMMSYRIIVFRRLQEGTASSPTGPDEGVVACRTNGVVQLLLDSELWVNEVRRRFQSSVIWVSIGTLMIAVSLLSHNEQDSVIASGLMFAYLLLLWFIFGVLVEARLRDWRSKVAALRSFGDRTIISGEMPSLSNGRPFIYTATYFLEVLSLKGGTIEYADAKKAIGIADDSFKRLLSFMRDHGAVTVTTESDVPWSITLTEKGSEEYCNLVSLLGRLVMNGG